MKTTIIIIIFFAALGLLGISTFSQTQPGTIQTNPKIQEQLERIHNPEVQQQMISDSLTLLTVAMVTDDLEVARALIWCDHDSDRRLANAEAQNLLADYQFYLASDIRFGEKETARLRDQFDLNTPDTMMLGSVGWKVSGNQASPVDANGFEAKLHRVNQIWRLDMTPRPAPASIDEAARAIAMRARAIRLINDDLNRGKYSTTSQLADAIKRALAKAN